MALAVVAVAANRKLVALVLATWGCVRLWDRLFDQYVMDPMQRFIAQMLRHARESGGGGWMSGEDSAASSLVEVAEEHLGKALAQSGGLGLSDLIARSLQNKPG